MEEYKKENINSFKTRRWRRINNNNYNDMTCRHTHDTYIHRHKQLSIHLDLRVFLCMMLKEELNLWYKNKKEKKKTTTTTTITNVHTKAKKENLKRQPPQELLEKIRRNELSCQHRCWNKALQINRNTILHKQNPPSNLFKFITMW